MSTLMIGAGPAGLALAACLGERGHSFRIVERGEHVGTSWRNHYRRLHLHTAKNLSTLPGLGFAKGVPLFPSRAQVVDYLERYARHFGIEPSFGVDVTSLERDGNQWVARAGEDEFRAKTVVLTTGLNRKPIVPKFAGTDVFKGTILHSADYRSADAFRGQRVLVIGIGNTGGEIALDLCEHDCSVGLCIRGPLHVVPREFLGRPTQVTGVLLRRTPLWFRDRISQFASNRTFGDLSDIGIERPKVGVATMIEKQRKIPLIDIGTIKRIRAGDITVYPGVDRFDEAGVHFLDGQHLEADAVIMATGYRSGIEDWVEGGESIVDGKGYPIPSAGETALQGLYTLGFSNVLTGLLRQIGIEAPKVADAIASV